MYEAVQEGLGRRVAVKVVYDELAMMGDAVARFRREAQAAAALGHPNIVAVTDFELGPPPFLVMELLQGASLQQVISRGGALAVARVVPIAAQVLSALGAAHRAGLVHRDVKPDNVFLTSTSAAADLVKLLDFGVVKQAGDPHAAQLTATGAMVGSPAFMSPEQIRGRPVDPRTDLYGVGICMYNALTGRMPFHASSLPELVFAIDEKLPTPILQLRPDVPPGLAQLVERAMAKSPDARFGSAEEMLAALAPWSGAVTAPTTSAAPMVTTPMVASMGAPMVAPMRSAPPPHQAPTAPPLQPLPLRPAVLQGGQAAERSGGSSRALLIVVLVFGGLVLVSALVAGALARRGVPASRPTTLSRDADAAVADTDASATAAASRPSTDPLPATPPSSAAASGGVPHGGPPPPPPVPVEDAGSRASAPSFGRTNVSVSAGAAYHIEHIYFVVDALMPRIDTCAQGTPSSDFNQGSEVLTLASSFTVTVDAAGVARSVGHPTDSYSRSFDSCVRPILMSTAWGKTAHPSAFVLSFSSRRRAK